MAVRKTLATRFLHSAKSSSTFQALTATQHSHTAPTLPKRDRPEHRKTLPAQRRISQSASPFAGGLPPPPYLPISVGDDLMKSIRSSMPRNRIHPIPPPRSDEDGGIATNKVKISLQDAMKLLQASRIETARAKLKAIPKSCISYSHFTQICREVAGGTDDVAAALEKSVSVVVLGDIVFLRPEQVARAIESVINPLPIDPRRSELREMEAEKAVIDGMAKLQVMRELWAGLGLAVFQTAGFMRLTFWDLSWDVMEPICFFTTSISFLMGWAFFLRTAKEPSFEGFFAGRFAAKQRRLMKAHSFDFCRFNELRRALVAGSEECDNGPSCKQSDAMNANLQVRLTT